MVAARDIEPGEIIFVDEPFAVGSYETDWLKCASCFGKVSS